MRGNGYGNFETAVVPFLAQNVLHPGRSGPVHIKPHDPLGPVEYVHPRNTKLEAQKVMTDGYGRNMQATGKSATTRLKLKLSVRVQ